jgi:alpha-amylase/alpha-mannosidase (GH57 family)
LPAEPFPCYGLPMICVGFAFNFNIQRCEIEVGEEDVIVDEGYAPLIKGFLERGLKADLFISGFSTRRILEIDSSLIDTIKAHLGSSFELGTYTYTHPIPQLLSPREFEKQIQKGLEIDQEIFGVTPMGFLPPEFAYTGKMARILGTQGIQWIIVLSSHIKRSQPDLEGRALHLPYTTREGDFEFTLVPAVYELPDTPQRFFKLMMKGEVDVETVIKGVKSFASAYPDSLLLFKRDAETIFIDAFNSGFTETASVFGEFITELSELKEVRFTTIGAFLENTPAQGTIKLADHLGNTRIETFTEGEAKPIWDLTCRVRDRLMEAERDNPDAESVRQAWEHLLLSHNSDGRIGYWFSEWNPGEHRVASTRRQFIEDNLKKAIEALS